jgi:hypothetical protein
MNGLELAVRHSYAPNKLRYCGAADYSAPIESYVKTQNAALESALQSNYQTLTAAYHYLRVIADANRLQPFDLRVAEAYWIGNELLENVKTDDIRRLFLGRFAQSDYWDDALAAEFAQHIPSGIAAHHSFHVLYTHFMAAGLENTLSNLDSCRIAPARVVEIGSRELVVEHAPLEMRKRQVMIGKPVQRTVSQPFDDVLSAGDWISVHWSTHCMRLSAAQKQAVERFTQQNIAAINAAAISSSDA